MKRDLLRLIWLLLLGYVGGCMVVSISAVIWEVFAHGEEWHNAGTLYATPDPRHAR